MDQAEIMRIFEDCKAIITDTHVVYTSGRHGKTYINKDAIYPNTSAISKLCETIADHFAPFGVEVVAAPAIGGVILSQWVAHHLSMRNGEVLAVYAEKLENGSFGFFRGYDQLIDRKRVLVMEDILTTGGSVKDVSLAIRRAGGEIVGLGVLCNRGGVSAEQVGHPPELYSLVEVSMESWNEENCPLCAEGVPINTNIGKGREFLQKKM